MNKQIVVTANKWSVCENILLKIIKRALIIGPAHRVRKIARVTRASATELLGAVDTLVSFHLRSDGRSYSYWVAWTKEQEWAVSKIVLFFLCCCWFFFSLKENGNTFRGSDSDSFSFVSILKGNRLTNERICSLRSKFFSLRADLILKGLRCQG